MLPWSEQFEKERYKDFLRAAEHHRLVCAALEGQPEKHKSLRRAMIWLSYRLSNLGKQHKEPIKGFQAVQPRESVKPQR
jgi:hypothetical protein